MNKILCMMYLPLKIPQTKIDGNKIQEKAFVTVKITISNLTLTSIFIAYPP
jgi:hypothetical protein